MNQDVFKISELDIMRFEMIELKQRNLVHDFQAQLKIEHEKLQKQRLDIELRLFAEWGVDPKQGGPYEIDVEKKELRRVQPVAAVPEDPQPHLVDGKKRRRA